MLASFHSTSYELTHQVALCLLIPELKKGQIAWLTRNYLNSTTFSKKYPHPKILNEAGFLLYGLEGTKSWQKQKKKKKSSWKS